MLSPQIPPHVSDAIRKLPPEIKRQVKEAIRALSADPLLGEPLKRELAGLWKYRVRRHRIIYEPRPPRLLIYAVGHRSTVYDDFAGLA